MISKEKKAASAGREGRRREERPARPERAEAHSTKAHFVQGRMVVRLGSLVRALAVLCLGVVALAAPQGRLMRRAAHTNPETHLSHRSAREEEEGRGREDGRHRQLRSI